MAPTRDSVIHVMGAAEVFSQCEGIFTVRIRVNDG